MIQIRKFVTSSKQLVSKQLVSKELVSKDLLPKCISCKNFIKHIENDKEYDNLGKCKKSGYFLPNTIGAVNFYAFSCRTDEKFCGKTGQYFESKL